jgi:hypothetical protein
VNHPKPWLKAATDGHRADQMGARAPGGLGMHQVCLLAVLVSPAM